MLEAGEAGEEGRGGRRSGAEAGRGRVSGSGASAPVPGGAIAPGGVPAAGQPAPSAPAALFHPELSPARRWAILICFVWAAAVSILGQLTMTTCLPAIVAEFGVGTETGQWLTTSYMVALGVMVPCSGYLTTRFQSRHLFLAANLVFLAGLLGAAAPSFAALVAVRCVQGLAAGLFIPLMQIVAFRLFPPQRRGFAMGVVAVALAAGPTFGPLVAGACTDLWGWRSVFLVVGAMTLVSIATYPVTRRLSDPVRRSPFDAPSLALLAVGFSGLVVGASNLGLLAPGAAGGLLGGLAGSALPIALGAWAVALFVRRQGRLESPLLNLAPLRDRRFLAGVLANTLLFGALINTEVFMSVYIQSDQGFSPTEAALCLLPGAVVSAVMSPFTGRALDARGPLGLAAAGLAVVVASGAMSALVGQATPLWFSALAFVLRGAGNALVMQNIQTWAVNILPAGLMTHGTAIANTSRQVGGALVNALLFALMGAASPALGEMGGIRLAFAVSTAATAALGAWVVGVLRRAGRGR